MGVDLHIHTTYSDGSFTPKEVVMYARYKNISTIAITDHDTVVGNEEAVLIGKKIGVEVIPGVEISVCCGEKEIHLLGYFVNFKSKKLMDKLEILRNSKKKRNPLIVKKLKKLGVHIDLNMLKKKLMTENICRPHIAREMVRLGYVKDIKEAFERYLKVGRPAYVPKERIEIEEAINIVKECGGISVIAHPTTMKLSGFEEYLKFFKYLKGIGLDGIEVFYNGYENQMMLSIANKLNMIKTAGSDFHGLNIEGNSDMINYSSEILSELKKRHHKTILS